MGGGGDLFGPLQVFAMDRAKAAKICTKVEANVLYKPVLLGFSNFIFDTLAVEVGFTQTECGGDNLDLVLDDVFPL